MKEILKSGKRLYYVDDNNHKKYITDTNGKKLYFTDDFVDISYFSKNSVANALSNLFPYDFSFKGYPVRSVEGLLQSLKHESSEIQRFFLDYYGKDAYHIRASSFLNPWQETGTLYFMGTPMNRFDIDYQRFLNDIYSSIGYHSLFSNVLKYTDRRVLLHSSGQKDPTKTILTPREYIDRLTIIRDSLTKEEAKERLSELSEDITEEYKDTLSQKQVQLTKK